VSVSQVTLSILNGNLILSREGRCCPDKYLKSCNTILAKTVLRFINKDGKNFVTKFQPEISAKIGKIIKNYLNSAMGQVEAELMID